MSWVKLPPVGMGGKDTQEESTPHAKVHFEYWDSTTAAITHKARSERARQEAGRSFLLKQGLGLQGGSTFFSFRN